MSDSPSRSGGRPGRARPTFRRRVLALARKLGLEVVDLGPGAAIVSRRGRTPKLTELDADTTILARRGSRPKLTVLDPDTTVVTRRGNKPEHRSLEDGTWLLTADGSAGVDVAVTGKRGWIVARRDPSPQAELNLETQTIEHLGARHVAWLVQRYQIDLVLDIGANAGQFASGLRKRGYKNHIASFEPVPRFAERLSALADGDEQWTVRQLALGSTEGTVPINVQRTFSSLLPSSDYGKQRFTTLRELSDTEQVDVPLRRLDTILDEVLEPLVAAGVERPRIYLKMDTQGFDVEVFRGLGERVQDIVAMQSEVALLMVYEDMPRMPEAVATYEAAGFEITGLYPVTREADGRVVEYDCTLVRPGAFPGR